MKYLINVIIGLLTVLSSCLGAKIATEHELQRPEKQARIAEARATELKAKTIADSIAKTQGIIDSIQIAEANMEIAAARSHEISREKRLRFNQLCQLDWDLAKTVDDKREVVAGRGVFMLVERGTCTADSWGRMIWADVEK